MTDIRRIKSSQTPEAVMLNEIPLRMISNNDFSELLKLDENTIIIPNIDVNPDYYNKYSLKKIEIDDKKGISVGEIKRIYIEVLDSSNFVELCIETEIELRRLDAKKETMNEDDYYELRSSIEARLFNYIIENSSI
ncbi:MAG: hypothetical protein HPM95_20165, partial [Alphaproteobacteria bacterium]|nr:hypothetical protein [Alphaproteobacteria bacterium]